MRTILCIALIIAAFALGVYVGRLPITSLILDDASSAPTSESVSATPTKQAATGGTTISTASLSDGQKKLLSALGIDATAIVITPAMVACAEVRVGAARLKEIEGGATPSMSEGLTLLACYK